MVSANIGNIRGRAARQMGGTHEDDTAGDDRGGVQPDLAGDRVEDRTGEGKGLVSKERIDECGGRVRLDQHV